MTFTVDAYPDDVFEGKVTQVRLEATVTANVVTYSVVISAPNPDLKLKPGLTASVSIRTMERPDALAVPYKALRFIPDAKILSMMRLRMDEAAEPAPGKKVVWMKNGDRLTPREIVTGSSTLASVEVIDGLVEGDEVVTGTEIAVEAARQATGGLIGPPGPRGGRR